MYIYPGHPETQALVVKCLLDLAFCPNTLPELCANSEVLDGVVNVISGDREGGKTGLHMFDGDTSLMALQVVDEMSKLQPSIILGKVRVWLETLVCLTTPNSPATLQP